jgi:hypothetical protein
VSDVVVAVLLALCTLGLGAVGFTGLPTRWKRRGATGFVAVGLYLAGVQAYRARLVQDAVDARPPGVTTHASDARARRREARRIALAVFDRGARFLHGRQSFAYVVATASTPNTRPGFDSFQCEVIRGDASAARERLLNELPGEDRLGEVLSSYVSKDCVAALPTIITDLYRLAMRIEPD